VKRWIAAANLMWMSAAGAASAQVYLRGQPDAVSGQIAAVGPEGVGINIGGVVKTIGWDRVREVRGDHGAEAARELALVGELWRARMRLERGDLVAAEPLFEALVARERGVVGPTSSVVFEGLLRCRLRRGATAWAVWAWLDWVRCRGGAIGGAIDPSSLWIGGRIESSPVIDAKTGLLTGLPPIFLHDAALDASAASDEWGRFLGADPAVAELAMLYRAAARFEVGLNPELGPISSAGESVRLVADMVLARCGSDAERQAALGNLRARLSQKDIEPWVECWCRVGIGRSLVREQDSDLKRQGVIQLLHAPSRFMRVSTSAASIALAEAAVTLHELGDEQGALALKNELSERFARSAAVGWPKLREIRQSPDPARSGAGNKPEVKPAPGKGGGASPPGQGG
jgi:hypothetical protein